ncbi:MAG TPA: hypothetical protein VIH89_04215 [Candidatus Sulfotelmatobacter sp.]|jgi:hypothetical protein
MSGAINPEAAMPSTTQAFEQSDRNPPMNIGGIAADGGQGGIAGWDGEPGNAGGAGSFAECGTEVLTGWPGFARLDSTFDSRRSGESGCPHIR